MQTNQPSLQHLKRHFEKGNTQLKLNDLGKQRKDFISLTVYISDSLKPLIKRINN